MADKATPLSPLARVGHAQHCKVCLLGLPASQVEVDSSRLALIFYCLGSLDLLDLLETKTNESDRQIWREWIWEQQTKGPYGTGFKPSPYMTPKNKSDTVTNTEFDTPHMITTYTALLSLSILRDDFSQLDRPGLLKFLRSCQREDGSFFTEPGQGGESDIRTTYCAFAISSMLNDWSGLDVDRAIGFITRCRTYEGGYGQSPFSEAQGGTTYCALASLYLAPSSSTPHAPLTPRQRLETIRWLVHNQGPSGGFHGRTEKEDDACYCFWCGASLELLRAEDLVDTSALASFVARCQFKFGGIAKSPGQHPDPYHTYLSLAAISIHPPTGPETTTSPSWKFKPLDPLLNANEETATWARSHIPAQKSNGG